MKIILLGPPGAGKGTQAELLINTLHIPHIAAGDIIREAIAKNDDFGKHLAGIVASGQYVADETVIALVKQRIAEPDCARGFILDGFPRTPTQAQALNDAGVTLDYVIQIQVPDDVIVKRLAGRMIHQPSGRVYHVISHPPKRPGFDDVTGEPLTHRTDDNEETVRTRLEVYHAKTEPLVNWYKQKENGLHFVTVDGTQDERHVNDAILTSINAK